MLAPIREETGQMDRGEEEEEGEADEASGTESQQEGETDEQIVGEEEKKEKEGSEGSGNDDVTMTVGGALPSMYICA